MSESQTQMHDLVEQLRQASGIFDQLPEQERAMVRDALGGADVYAIAQQHRVSEGAVWTTLTNAARLASGTPIAEPVETGGLGSDPSAGEGD